MAKKRYIYPVEEECKPLCEKLYARVVKMAFRFCEPEVVEEVIQHASEIVIRQWYWLCWCVDPQIYVYVMKAVVHSRWRVLKQQRRLILPEEDTVLNTYPDDDTAEWAATAADFMQALEKTTLHEMQVYFLRYIEGWSCQRTAQHLKISEGAVRTACSRADTKIRHFLTNQGYPLERVKP